MRPWLRRILRPKAPASRCVRCGLAWPGNFDLLPDSECSHVFMTPEMVAGVDWGIFHRDVSNTDSEPS